MVNVNTNSNIDLTPLYLDAAKASGGGTGEDDGLGGETHVTDFDKPDYAVTSGMNNWFKKFFEGVGEYFLTFGAAHPDDRGKIVGAFAYGASRAMLQ